MCRRPGLRRVPERARLNEWLDITAHGNDDNVVFWMLVPLQ